MVETIILMGMIRSYAINCNAVIRVMRTKITNLIIMIRMKMITIITQAIQDSVIISS
jgi:hypothetical protein